MAELAARLPDTRTRLVYLADREADLLPLMIRARDLEHPAGWLIRAKHNRLLPDGEGASSWCRESGVEVGRCVRPSMPIVSVSRIGAGDGWKPPVSSCATGADADVKPVRLTQYPILLYILSFLLS